MPGQLRWQVAHGGPPFAPRWRCGRFALSGKAHKRIRQFWLSAQMRASIALMSMTRHQRSIGMDVARMPCAS
jgi:hypothetical protein